MTTRSIVLLVIGLIAVAVAVTGHSISAHPLVTRSDLFYLTENATLPEDDDFTKQKSHISYYYKSNAKSHSANIERPKILSRPTPDAYNSQRNKLFLYEESKALGADVWLDKRELQANEKIMSLKTAEYDVGLVTPHLFKPSQHIFTVLEAINNSTLFAVIKSMPKGAILHAHDTALCSTDFLIELTYRPNVWVCEARGGAEVVALKFSKQRPTEQLEGNCKWELLTELRQTRGSDAVDKYLREGLSMYPTQKFADVNDAWERFRTIFGLMDGLVTHAPSWADYYYNALTEFYADGVQYLEFRSTLPTLYDLEGTKYTYLDTVRIYVETLEKFKKANPGFIGSRMIYAPIRHTDEKTVAEYIKICVEIQAKYPDFVAGFDLVGQEELGQPLKNFLPELLSMPDHIDFFFHAGETNWYGSSVDENLIDAVLLGTKRIGHGFGIVKHPLVLQMVKENQIAIEVNPVSNQVLQLVADYRNHPCSHLFADNYPVVISSDDPSLWKAAPLSHDMYIAFVGIASAHADIRLLKKLAINSIQYSSLNDIQKKDALLKWQQKWDHFIETILTEKDNSAPTLKID